MELHPSTPAERPALRRLYRRAFPACERKSWSELERLQKAGRAEVLTVAEGGALRGILVTLPTPELVLGDFLAIFPHLRCGGTGTAVIRAVRERCGAVPVCLEIEDPDEPGAPNAALRLRRRNFYLRNGLLPVAKMHIYGTDMELLASDASVTYEQYRALLRRVLGGAYVDANLTRRAE